MKEIRLTNLGNLTIQNMLGLNEQYRENAELKRNKLAKLWDSKEQMEIFEYLFSSYHGQEVIPVIEKNKESYLIFPKFNEDFKLGKTYSEAIKRFEEMGLVTSSKSDSLEELVAGIEKDKRTNPVKGMRRSTVELTGLCNLRCKHCYRGGSREGEYGLSADEIKRTLKPLLRAGISYIMFTGGEVTLRKEDMLEIIDYASQFLELKGVSAKERLQYESGKPNPTINDVLQSEMFMKLKKKLMKQLSLPREEILVGEWEICNENTPEDVRRLVRRLAQWNLNTAQEPSKNNLDSIGILSNAFFEDQRDLVRKLKSYGNVAMQTSLDSYDEATTDKNRGRKGVFAHVKSLAKVSKEEGFDLSVQGHNMGGRKTPETKRSYTRLNKQFSILDTEGMFKLGNAVRGNFKTRNRRSKNNYIGALGPSKKYGDGWCGGFTTPENIHIRPTGNIGNCLYAYALEQEFGNIKNESMANIINNIQNTRIYQMFHDGSIEKYQNELDKSLFDSEFSKSCEPMILTLTYGLLKERFKRQGFRDYRRRANQEVASIYKFQKHPEAGK